MSHASSKPRKQITNRQLAILASSAFSCCLLSVSGYFAASVSQKDWIRLQAGHLAQDIGKGFEATENIIKKDRKITVPVLMYHHVGPLPENSGDLRKDQTVLPEQFELHMAWLKGQGFESISLAGLLAYQKGTGQLPEKPILITFDDGYGDALENAVPVLKKYGYTASFAIITQFAGITQGDSVYATWDQIQGAQKQGMEIISHTQDHFNGTSAAYDRNFVLRNLRDSRKDIQNHLGTGTVFLAYPYGLYSSEYLELAKLAGYEAALTANPGKEISLKNLMEIPRLKINENMSLEQFQALIQNKNTVVQK